MSLEPEYGGRPLSLRHVTPLMRCDVALFLLRRSSLEKTTLHLLALGDNGKVLRKKKFRQRQLITFTANLENGVTEMVRRLISSWKRVIV
jgi:hypothetical protein